MPSRVNSYFPEDKIVNPNPAPNPKPGAQGTVKVKPIKIYPKSHGLRA